MQFSAEALKYTAAPAVFTGLKTATSQPQREAGFISSADAVERRAASRHNERTER
jgi:hypothetical protein